MTPLHEAAPQLASSLDALTELDPRGIEIAEALESEYCARVKQAKGLSVLKARHRGDIKFAVFVEGHPCPRHIRAEEGIREIDLTLERGDEQEFTRFIHIAELLNDKFERIGRGRPFKGFGRKLRSLRYDVDIPHFVFTITIRGDE